MKLPPKASASPAKRDALEQIDYLGTALAIHAESLRALESNELNEIMNMMLQRLAQVRNLVQSI